MLLLGALFALCGAGFWLCCLTDVALTPGRECRALPKAAWIVLVAATFVAGAVVWLAFRRPAQLTDSPAPSGRGAYDVTPQAPERRYPSLQGGGRRGPQAPTHAGVTGPEPGPARGGPGVTRSGSRDGRSGPERAGDGPAPAEGDSDGWDGPGMCGSPEADAALLRHPAGRSRPRGAASPARPLGPDDDPEFLRSLKRAIHSAETDDDPGSPGGPAAPLGLGAPPGPASWPGDES